MNLDEEGAFHVHMEDDPYCISYTYFKKGDKEEQELSAQKTAHEYGGVVVGPFESDTLKCAYRIMRRGSLAADLQERLDRVAEDESIPENERTAAAPYAGMYNYVGWHVHTNGSGWCRSFSSRDRAYRWIQDTREERKPPNNPRIDGPLRHPAAACQYFWDNNPE